MTDRSADVAIVGAGIVGLAHAYMALQKGLKVVLFDRDQFAVGASVRNFGLIWPIGQTPGNMLARAMRSRKHWDDVSAAAGFWLNPNGSIHLAYHDDEWQVLHEFVELQRDAGYECKLLTAEEVTRKSQVVNPIDLKGGLWSETEATVDPHEAVRRLPHWLSERYGLTLRFGQVVTAVSMPNVTTPQENWRVGKVFVCSGADFETLYPELLTAETVTKCKLQMMRAASDEPLNLGPTLCGGLTLRHYAAFATCPSLPVLSERFSKTMAAYEEDGIHVLIAQNESGEFIIGDSHHYSRTVEPFDRESINKAILGYLATFTVIPSLQVIQRWHGVYPKVYGASDLVLSPEPGVTVVTGLGGAGMTLSFGLAEELIAQL
jgi:FAD dependent oxidoreductase TIGR03364